MAIPAHPLALDSQRRLDERRQRALTRYYCDAGVGGLAVGVHTTQFAIREAGLYEPVLSLAADSARDWSGEDLAMIAGLAGRTDQAVAEADIAVTRMSFRYFEDHPHFISMLNTENLHGARILKKIRQMHFPLVELIADILKRGQAAGIMREDVNPIQLYISIASLGYFYFSNYATLSTIFERDLLAEDTVVEREMHVIDMVMAFLAPDTRKVELLPSEALRPACRGW